MYFYSNCVSGIPFEFIFNIYIYYFLFQYEYIYNLGKYRYELFFVELYGSCPYIHDWKVIFRVLTIFDLLET